MLYPPAAVDARLEPTDRPTDRLTDRSTDGVQRQRWLASSLLLGLVFPRR
jgi:hypothetical protein